MRTEQDDFKKKDNHRTVLDAGRVMIVTDGDYHLTATLIVDFKNDSLNSTAWDIACLLHAINVLGKTTRGFQEHLLRAKVLSRMSILSMDNEHDKAARFNRS
jgi:hypothetical protein